MMAETLRVHSMMGEDLLFLTDEKLRRGIEAMFFAYRAFTADPDLILADIQLADGSSGIDAVNELLRDLGDIPVIFITAFPERLLTGERPEPAFLISKPYTEEQVRSAVSQAMFFSSTEGLDAT